MLPKYERNFRNDERHFQKRNYIKIIDNDIIKSPFKLMIIKICIKYFRFFTDITIGE